VKLLCENEHLRERVNGNQDDETDHRRSSINKDEASEKIELLKDQLVRQ